MVVTLLTFQPPMSPLKVLRQLMPSMSHDMSVTKDTLETRGKQYSGSRGCYEFVYNGMVDSTAKGS